MKHVKKGPENCPLYGKVNPDLSYNLSIRVSAWEGIVTNFPPIEIVFNENNYLDMKLHSSGHPTMHVLLLTSVLNKIVESYYLKYSLVPFFDVYLNSY